MGGRVATIGVPVLLGCLVFAGTLAGEFVYDDPASVRFSRELGEQGVGAFVTSAGLR